MKQLMISVALIACSNTDAKGPIEKVVEKKAAPIDPATFVAADLSSVPALAGHTVKAPPGVRVMADPKFGEPKSMGAILVADNFALHVWWSTIGGERTVKQMQVDGGKYVETTCNPDLCQYTVEMAGVKRYGFFRPVDRREDADLGAKDAQLLCGTAKDVDSPEALAPYRAACDSVARKNASSR